MLATEQSKYPLTDHISSFPSGHHKLKTQEISMMKMRLSPNALDLCSHFLSPMAQSSMCHAVTIAAHDGQEQAYFPRHTNMELVSPSACRDRAHHLRREPTRRQRREYGTRCWQTWLKMSSMGLHVQNPVDESKSVMYVEIWG